MKIENNSRVHVTRLNGKHVNFYGTLINGLDTTTFYMKLTNCTNANYNGVLIYMPRSDKFGKYKQDYYTLATDEEDTEALEAQHIKKENRERRYMLMEFEVGDRVHVTRFKDNNVDFFTTLQYANLPGLYQMINSTDSNYNKRFLSRPNQQDFGPGKKFYYTPLADEEDTEEPEVQHIKRENKIELDNHYIIEVKKGLYVRNATSNYFFKFTKDINKADVYEYENAAMKQAVFVDGRVLNLKRYVEVE